MSIGLGLTLTLSFCTPSPAQDELNEPEIEKFPSVHVFVREIRVIGSTIFSSDELAKVTASYVDRDLTSEDLEELRLALTKLYVNKGYVNSGATIPDQTVDNGVIILKITEGELTDVVVEGNKWFRTSYIQDRVALHKSIPINLIDLQNDLQLLEQDERLQRLNAELSPGLTPGSSILKVRVEERNPYRVWVEFDNYQSVAVGAEREIVTLAHQNLTRNGDILILQYGRSSGANPQIDTSYSLPLTSQDTTLILEYRKNDFIVVEDQFDPLDIKSESEIYGLTLRHPFYRTPNQEFAMAFTGERLHNETFLLGVPFSFSPGANEGRSTVTALRLSQEWTDRIQNQVIAIRSRFTLGMDALGATNNDSSVADSQFFSWQGQFQWARRLGAWGTQIILRTDLQLANDPLLPIEQMAVGGRFTVRGYRENQLVRDNGLVASMESRIPLVQNRSWATYLQLAPFFDFGRSWNTETQTPDPKSISSVGVGLRWAATFSTLLRLSPQFEIYWGTPLRKITTSGGDLQDEGIHLQLVLAAF